GASLPDSSIALLLALFMRDKPLTELGSLSSSGESEHTEASLRISDDQFLFFSCSLHTPQFP
ncbi:hypothetical protein, partial [Faecalibaculum rodentium]|uniref:hypothetical protein n=1 Tax=Faecalibaculum rodentium TaxID=1702221 RepID=UPI0025A08502